MAAYLAVRGMEDKNIVKAVQQGRANSARELLGKWYRSLACSQLLVECSSGRRMCGKRRVHLYFGDDSRESVSGPNLRTCLAFSGSGELRLAILAIDDSPSPPKSNELEFWSFVKLREGSEFGART